MSQFTIMSKSNSVHVANVQNNALDVQEIKSRVSRLEETSIAIKTAVKFMEFLVFHSDERHCTMITMTQRCKRWARRLVVPWKKTAPTTTQMIIVNMVVELIAKTL